MRSRLCFNYMSMRKVSNKDEESGAKRKALLAIDNKNNKRVKSSVIQSDSDSQYDTCEEQLHEIPIAASATDQCVSWEEDEVHNFKEHVKYIYNDLKTSDESNASKHFLAYICARLYDGTVHLYNPSNANNIKATMYKDRYHSFITSEIEATENVYEKMKKSGDPQSWRNWLKKNINSTKYGTYMEKLPTMTKWFAGIEKRKKVVLDIESNTETVVTDGNNTTSGLSNKYDLNTEPSVTEGNTTPSGVSNKSDEDNK